ncbi:MAG: G1 family glutamic endopeptidase [Thermoplasmata archaeon]
MIDLNGTNYDNGQVAHVVYNQALSLSETISNVSYTFVKWMSDDGTFANASATSTTFTVGSNPAGIGNLTMVVKNGSSNYNFAGLISSGSGITEVSGTFYIPSAGYSCHGACPGAQVLPIWVGIGGVFGGKGLWQAGFEVIANSTSLGGGTYARAFYESVGTGGSGPYFGSYVRLGTEVTVTVEYDASTHTSSFDIVCDSSTGCGTLPWTGSTAFTPDVTTGEWIAEEYADSPPSYSSNLSFSSPQLTGTGISSSSFVQPVGSFWFRTTGGKVLSVNSVGTTYFSIKEN